MRNKTQHWDKLLKIIKAMNYTHIVEIGVASGTNAIQLLMNTYPTFKYIGIDPYLPYDPNDINSTRERLEGNFSTMIKRLSRYFENKRANWLCFDSDVASHHFEDNSLDLVFIDATHTYEGVQKDLELYWPKVRIGGVLAGHDIDHPNFPGVRKAVDEFAEQYGVFVQVEEDVYSIYKRK